MELVAHRAGNTVERARDAVGHVDMLELDVHVLRGQVELRHEKVLHPTRRLWERWYLLPRMTRGVPIAAVLAAIPPDTPLMVDLKCFSRRSSRRIRRAIPETHPVVASTRSWWTLAPFADRPDTRRLRSCGGPFQLWWAANRATYGDNEGVCVHEARLTERVLRALQARTPIIFSWGATTTARCDELRRAGLTGIIVDDYSMGARSPGAGP